jgi:hypothetical protein
VLPWVGGGAEDFFGALGRDEPEPEDDVLPVLLPERDLVDDAIATVAAF